MRARPITPAEIDAAQLVYGIEHCACGFEFHPSRVVAKDGDLDLPNEGCVLVCVPCGRAYVTTADGIRRAVVGDLTDEQIAFMRAQGMVPAIE